MLALSNEASICAEQTHPAVQGDQQRKRAARYESKLLLSCISIM